jgi:hypothetical protein
MPSLGNYVIICVKPRKMDIGSSKKPIILCFYNKQWQRSQKDMLETPRGLG